MIIMLAALAIGVAPSAAWRVGDEISTGADLVQACSDLAALPRELACAYYLRGVAAMAETARQATYDHYHVSGAQRVNLTCPPPGTTTFTIISGIEGRVKANATLQSGPAPKVIVDALQQLYPCAADERPTPAPNSANP